MSRVMIPLHPNWNGTLLLSRNILIEKNIIYNCEVGINLLQGENIVVRNNDITSNASPFQVDPTSVFQYTVTDNIGYANNNYP
jgi:parallel beta-helix repeat protein